MNDAAVESIPAGAHSVVRKTLHALVLSIAVAASAAIAQEKAAPKVEHSGFLGSYAGLQPAADREGVLLYIRKGPDFRSYTKIMFESVEVWPSPTSAYKGVQTDMVKRMADGFAASFRRALEPQYQIVTAPGPDVLRVRAAITGVQLVKPPLNPSDLLPIKAVFNVARSAAGGAPQVAEMTAELEVLDSGNNRVAAAIITRKGDKTLAQGEQITWKHLEAITDYWGRNFRQRLDELRGSAR